MGTEPLTGDASSERMALAEAAGGFEPAARTRRLAVRRLTLTEFRSYAALRLEVDDRPVVLTGANGAGKTNLLEAVSFLAPGRGLRRAALTEVTRRPAPPGAGWAVAARLATPTGEIAIGTGLEYPAPEAPPRRTLRIDGRNAASQAELAERVAMIWLTPQMDRLFGEGAGNRRRFFDRLVFGFHPRHAWQLTAYERAMRERSRLLKEGRRDDRWLMALESEMAANGVAVAAARREVALRLQAAAEAPDGPFPTADLRIAGTVEDGLAAAEPAEAEAALARRLAELRRIDATAGGATEGPHRSDLLVRHRAKDMPADQCSTGEQKALLLGLVLANARLLTAERGLAPLLLLDEVAAHLDAGRRAALFSVLLDLGCQAWLTGTDAGLFAPLAERAQHFAVLDGAVREISPGDTI